MGQWAMGMVESAGLIGVVFLMFLENVFPPIPSEAIMPLAGFLAAQGKLPLYGVILAGTAGSVLGALPLYYLGRWVGGERIENWAACHGRWLTTSRQDVQKARGWFERHGGKTVLLCRLIPVVRSLISIPAGIARMNLGRFLLFTALGTAAWSTLLAGAGYWLEDNFQVVSRYLDPVSWVVLALIVLAYVVRVVRQGRQQATRR